ncbi:MAG: hypothetical protein PHE28_03065 [Bacteroidales bacterium]|nr:hypothetical protein [Bacteroidales bacterium]
MGFLAEASGKPMSNPTRYYYKDFQSFTAAKQLNLSTSKPQFKS